MHTESEAKQLWCPMVRFAQLEGSQTSSRGSLGGIPPEDFLCLASGCAMWRWGPEPMDTRETMLVKKGTRERVPGGYSEDVEFVLVDPDEPDPRVWRGYCGLARRGDT